MWLINNQEKFKIALNPTMPEKKKVHILDQDKCIKCGACFNACKFSAINKG